MKNKKAILTNRFFIFALFTTNEPYLKITPIPLNKLTTFNYLLSCNLMLKWLPIIFLSQN
jgi:hypothetical protein